MSKESVAVQVEGLITDELQQQDIELIEVQHRREQNGLMLRIFIDTESGVTLDICTHATRIINKVFDEHDEIQYDYLEVSSPGIDRVLKKESEFQKFCGEKVKVKCYQAMDGQKNFTGKLLSVDSELLTIEMENHSVQIPRAMISIVRLNPDF
ncbi:MAG: ribosome maturation factor RimP [Bacillota bacterium]|nr:ribosome maturation factor RimP [Bacillota bacterium]